MIEHLVDEGSLEAVADDLRTTDPLSFPGYAEALERAAAKAAIDESVAWGRARIAGHDLSLAWFDFRFIGGSMGEVAGERIARAMEDAASRRVPFVLRTETGGARMQEGMRSLVQMPKLVAARRSLADAHVPFLAVLGNPTTGGVLASIAALADVTLAEEGATMGFAGPRLVERFTGRSLRPESHAARSALEHGLVDAVLPRDEVRGSLAVALDVLAPDRPEGVAAPQPPEPSDRDPWDAVRAAGSPGRPLAPDLVRSLPSAYVELRGDRSGGQGNAVFTAFTRVAGRRVLAVALDRTHPGPDAYRKVRRCIPIASRLHLPIVTLIDTPGADPSESSEAGGIASEIAALLQALLQAPVPVVSVVTGEGGSGGALAFATADVLLAYEASVFSVIAVESAADILWRDPTRAPDAARLLRLTAPDLVDLGVADALVAEPPSPASLAPVLAYHLARLEPLSAEELLESRAKRWRGDG